MGEEIKTLLPLASVIGLMLALWVAKKNGVFSRKNIKVGLYGLDDESIPVKEVIFIGPIASINVLVPVAVRVSNLGSAPAKDLEVSLEGFSDVVVNYPKLFISPSVSSALKTIEAPAVRLAGNRFRRVFALPNISPGNSVQLNNAGLPRNTLKNGDSFHKSILNVTIYDSERKPKTEKYCVWFIDATDGDSTDPINTLATYFKEKFNQKPLATRIFMRLRSSRYGSNLMLFEITELRKENMENDSDPFYTIEMVNTSYGYRCVTGHILHGPSGIH